MVQFIFQILVELTICCCNVGSSLWCISVSWRRCTLTNSRLQNINLMFLFALPFSTHWFLPDLVFPNVFWMNFHFCFVSSTTRGKTEPATIFNIAVDCLFLMMHLRGQGFQLFLIICFSISKVMPCRFGFGELLLWSEVPSCWLVV